jgi:hypothetical protein
MRSIERNADRLPQLLEQLCRCLAFHAIHSEIAAHASAVPDMELVGRVDEALNLIAAAGYDVDTLCPPHERPRAAAGRVLARRIH